jgi:hypothetical protein
VDELVVAQPVQLRCRTNPHDPQRPKLPLPLLPSRIRELEPALYRFFGGAVQFRFGQEVSACAVEYFFALGAAFGSAFYTRHWFSPFCFPFTGGWRQGRFTVAAISGLFTRLVYVVRPPPAALGS